MNEEEGKPKADLNWDDEGVLPAVLSPDTEFVFRRMTEETLKAAAAANSCRVLDVGCGRAIDAAALAKKGGLLFGCEPSRIMLRKAREGLRKSGETVRLVGSLAETLPFAGQSFHRVVCKGAIDHFFSPERAVGEMGRVACLGGKVVISVANFESLSCFLSWNLNRFVSGSGTSPLPISGKSPRTTSINLTTPPPWVWPGNTCGSNPSGEFPCSGGFPGGRIFCDASPGPWP
jgi:SAM-dependent methyltransferase